VLLSSLVLAAGPVHAQPEIPEWTTTVDGLSSDADQAFAIALDSNGDVFAAGVVFEVSGPNFFVIKLDGTTGTEIWSESLGTGGALALAVDRDDNLVVAGDEPGIAVDTDVLVVKLDGVDGGELWRTAIDGGDNLDDVAFAVQLDGNNDVVAAGFTTNPTTGSDLFVVKLDGVTGVEEWRGEEDGTANDDDQLVAVALVGKDVVAAGFMRNTGTNADLAVTKYLPEPGHALLWGVGLPALLLLDRLRRRRDAGGTRPNE
jgi:hypothetical protein